jgi:alkylation response protein AidB-like acyl-CoA dehydrogenase
MNFAFSEEQEMLRQSVRAFLADKAPMAEVRRLMETEQGYDPGLWRETARQGWQGMHIPEQYGGSGYTYLEAIILMEEMGRTLFPSPFFSSVILGANALLVGGSEEQKAAVLPGVAAGERLLAVATVEASGRWDEAGVMMPARADGDGYILSGTKLFVVDGHNADLFVVAARTGEAGAGTDGVSLFLVEGDAPGVTRSRLETMDMTRKQAEVTFDDVRVPALALIGARGEGWPIIRKVQELAAVALAAEQVGGAAACLEMAVEYAKARVQFGRPIGSFQAVKHKCADMLVAVESAKSAAYYAGWAAAVDDEELSLVAPLAKAYCSEAFFSVASENIQVHGGIGFTWEHDAHLYFKRAKSSELMLGDPSYHRAVLAERIGL